MIKFAVADKTGEFVRLLKMGIKLFPPENGEDVSIDIFENNLAIQNSYEPGKYNVVIISYDLHEFTGMTVPDQIRKSDKKVVIAAYVKGNFLYTEKSELGRYELTGKRPPDYEEQLMKIYRKCLIPPAS